MRASPTGRSWRHSVLGEPLLPATLGGDPLQIRLHALVVLAEGLLRTVRIRTTPPASLPGDQEMGRSGHRRRKLFGHRVVDANGTAARRTDSLDEGHFNQDRKRGRLFIFNELEDLRALNAKEDREHLGRVLCRWTVHTRRLDRRPATKSTRVQAPLESGEPVS